MLRIGSWTARVIDHMLSLSSRRDSLTRLRHQLARSDVLGSSLALVQQLLPPETVARLGSPAVAFVFFLPDGRGYPTIIVADLANVAGRRDPTAFFAHEAMHFYYGRLSREREGASPDTVNGESALESLMTKLFEESLGDQFDKASALELSEREFATMPMTEGWRGFMSEYRREYAHAAEDLGALNRSLSAVASDSAELEAEARRIADSLPLEGRPIGFFITRTIRRQLGDARLASTVGSPRGWLRAYREAARMSGCRCPTLDQSWTGRVGGRTGSE